MSTIELTDEAMNLAQEEAVRRGVPVAEVVDEAVRRSIAGEDLRRLLAEFSADDVRAPAARNETAAQQIANEELAAARHAAATEH